MSRLQFLLTVMSLAALAISLLPFLAGSAAAPRGGRGAARCGQRIGWKTGLDTLDQPREEVIR